MPDEFGNVTDPLSGLPSADAGTPADPVEENRRLKAKLAQNENMLQQARPLVDLTRKLWNAPGGKEIVQRLQAGQPLSSDQQTKVDAALPPQGSNLTRDDVKEIMQEGFQTFEQQSFESRKAEKAFEDLHAKAAKELGEGYENIAGTEQWNTALQTTINMMQPTRDPKTGEVVSDPALKVPDGEDDPYYFAVKYAYGFLTGATPQTDEGGESSKPKPGSENSRRAAIAAQSSKPAGGPTKDGEPDSPELDWARSRGDSTVGKSFANG